MGAEGIAVGRKIGDPNIVFWSMQTVAVAAYLDGRSDDAIAIGVESLALATAMDWAFARLSATMCFVMGHSASGSDQLIARAREGIAMSEVLGETWERGSFYQFLAVGLLRRGDLTEALRAGRRSLALRRDLGDFVGVALALETVAVIESATGAASRAATILGIAAALWESIPAPILEPLRAGHERVELDARVALGDAAFEAAFRFGKTLPRGEAVDYALDTERPVGHATPNVARAPTPGDGLSRREREVATLVAGGSTNAQVAGSLFISERTVESHLASIFNKLGVDNRMQLARWVIANEAAPAS
jgi:non-specific serine/threonine protein kinase